MLFQSLLEPEGYRLALAETGAEALRQTRLLAPDLILLDVMMPEMDGYEVCRQMRADPALALIPIVMVTALNDQQSLLRGIEAGADDFLTKPFNRTELLARIRTITRLNRFRVVLDEQRRVSSERAQFLWAIERSADGYLLLDRHDRIQGGNRQARRFLGLPGDADTWPDQPFLALVATRYRTEPEAAWTSWPRLSDIMRYLVRPEGSEAACWLEVELLDPPTAGDGQRLVHIRDVTAQIQVQHDMWAFHSFISHKLRTPLTSLLGGMSLLLRRAQHEFSPETATLAELSYNGAQHLKQVVDTIFRYIESPTLLKHALGLPIADLPALIRRIAGALGLAAVELTLDPALHDQRLVLGAETIELLLTEILHNAYKFHPRQAPVVQIGVQSAATRAVIQLIDDGMFLPAEEIPQIMTPYHQIDREFTGQVPGMGLGMAIVAQVCWMSGGTCRVANRTDGPGLVVELEIPFAIAAANDGGVV